MHVCNVLDFRLHIYRGFRAMISGISGAHAFRAILLKAFVLGTFKRFRCPFGSPFSVDSTPIFRAIYFSGVPLSSGFLGDDFRVPPRGQTRLKLTFPAKRQKIDEKMVTKFHQLLATNRPMNEPRTYGELPDQRFRGMLVGACIYLGFGPFRTLLDLHFNPDFPSVSASIS